MCHASYGNLIWRYLDGLVDGKIVEGCYRRIPIESTVPEEDEDEEDNTEEGTLHAHLKARDRAQ